MLLLACLLYGLPSGTSCGLNLSCLTLYNSTFLKSMLSVDSDELRHGFSTLADSTLIQRDHFLLMSL